MGEEAWGLWEPCEWKQINVQELKGKNNMLSYFNILQFPTASDSSQTKWDLMRKDTWPGSEPHKIPEILFFFFALNKPLCSQRGREKKEIWDNAEGQELAAARAVTETSRGDLDHIRCSLLKIVSLQT